MLSEVQIFGWFGAFLLPHGKVVKVLLLHSMVDWCVDVSRGHFYAPHVPEILHATPRRHHHVGWINESIDMAYSSSE